MFSMRGVWAVLALAVVVWGEETAGKDLRWELKARDSMDWTINTALYELKDSAAKLLKHPPSSELWDSIGTGWDYIIAGRERMEAGDLQSVLPLTGKAEKLLSHFLNEDLSGGDSHWDRVFDMTRNLVACELYMLNAQTCFKMAAELAHTPLHGDDSLRGAIDLLIQAEGEARNASLVLARHAAKYDAAGDRFVPNVAQALSLAGVANALHFVVLQSKLKITGVYDIPILHLGEHGEGMEAGIPLGYGISLDLEKMLRLFNRLCEHTPEPCTEFLRSRGVRCPPPPSTVCSRGHIGRRVVHSLHLAADYFSGYTRWVYVMNASTMAVEYAEAHGFADPGTEARRASAADALARYMIDEDYRKSIWIFRLFSFLGLWFLAMAACGWWACTRRARRQQSGPRRRGRGGGLRRGGVGGRGGDVGGLWALTRRAASWAAGPPMSVYWACVGCLQAFAVLAWGGAGWVAGLPLRMYLYARRAWRWVAQLPRAWLAWARLRWCRIARAAAAKVYAIATTIMGAAATILGAAARLLERTTQDAGGGEDSAAAGAASQLRSDDRGPESSKCCVCMDAPRTHVFIPCGHKCVCLGCSKMMNGKGKGKGRGSSHDATKCPICREVVQGAYRVFD